MRIVDHALLERIGSSRVCEYCGSRLRHKAEVNHIIGRGLGGGHRMDVPLNCLAMGSPWDCGCHEAYHHGRITRDELVWITAIREWYLFEDAWEELRAIQRAHTPPGERRAYGRKARRAQRPVPPDSFDLLPPF